MSQFAILRTGKINSRHKLIRAIKHNAYPEHRKGFTTGRGGVEILQGNKNAHDDFNRMVADAGVKKIRKDAVLAIEFMASFSPEMQEKIDLDTWKKDTLKFFQDKYGEDKILQAVLHTDETTPHMHIMVVPLVTKQHKKGVKTTLSAKDLTGGKDGPEKLQKLQDEYAEAMQHHGLDRGVRGVKRKHQPLQQYVKELNQIRQEAKVIKGKKLNPNAFPKTAKKRLLGFEMPDYQKAFEAIKTKYRELKEKYNKLVVKVEELTVKNKRLANALDRIESEKTALEQVLTDTGMDVTLAENLELKQALQAEKGQHSAQIEGLQQQHDQELAQVAQERDEARQVAAWWEQGYHGKDPEKMNPRMRQWCEEQRSQRPQGVDNDRTLG